ncbi:MAG: type II secretion system F family protein [Candidatus Omnitrophota bacterium]|nr:MAG: type II secretion system F family protein [Candidatus Omnitrophota bacterium]
MPVYTYKARDSKGSLITGAMETETEAGLVKNLDRLGFSVTEIESEEDRKLTIDSFFERFQPVKQRELIFFTRQLATLLRSGSSLSTSLETILEQTRNKKLRGILEDIFQSVQKGESLSVSLSRHPRAFSELFISMVRVGETGGLLDEVLERLATLGTRQMETTSRIMSALIYPLVLVSVAFLIINFLLIGVLPKFVAVFNTSGVALPLPTKIILGLSRTLRTFFFPIVLFLGLGLIWFGRRLRDERVKEDFHAWLLKIPVFGGLYTKIQISRFARVTSALIASGIPILQAMDVTEKTVTNLAIRRAIKNIRFAITQGHSLVEPFKASGLFNPMVVQMISTGEKSGSLDRMLGEIAGFYEPEIEYTIKNLTSILEPFMLLAMGAMVAFIALSVLLPIFNLIKVFRG